MMIITIERKDYNGEIDQYGKKTTSLKRMKEFEPDNDMKAGALLGGLMSKQNPDLEKGFMSLDYVVNEEKERI